MVGQLGAGEWGKWRVCGHKGQGAGGVMDEGQFDGGVEDFTVLVQFL